MVSLPTRPALIPFLAGALLVTACDPEDSGTSGPASITTDTAGDEGEDTDASDSNDDDDTQDASGGPDGADSGPDGDSTTSDSSGDDTQGDSGSQDTVPEFEGTPTVIATAADGLDAPRDLQFAPDHPDQLWTVNKTFHGTVIFFDAGTAQQRSEVRTDIYAQHFMAGVSSIAFGNANTFASCQESRDEWNGVPQPPDDFMGPTLWPADLDTFAMVGQEIPSNGQEGCHLDMLHQSPLCMGIAHDSGNAYWVFDGHNGHIVYYDFVSDHGPGGGDHSDGVTRRYMDATVTRIPDAPSHMEVDQSTGWLYVADTGAGRVMRLDTNSGSYDSDLPGNIDGIPEYSSYAGATWEPFAEGLQQPSGLAIEGGRLFVGDRATSEIIAYDRASGDELDRFATDAVALAGLTIGPQGRLWYVDARADELVVIAR